MPEISGEWQALLTARLPFENRMEVKYYFRRSDTQVANGQHRPPIKIELVAIVYDSLHGHREVGRATDIFDSEQALADSIRMKGHSDPEDIIDSRIAEFRNFNHLRFFNNIIPRPSWLDEKIREA